MMLHRQNTGPRKAPMGRQPCPLCDEKPLCREIEQHLKAAHPEDVDERGDLLPTTLERLMQERLTDQDRRAARKREMLGTRDATMRQARAAVSDETEPASEETIEPVRETIRLVCETEPPVSGDDDMATKVRQMPAMKCAKCSKEFRYPAFLVKHQAKCKGALAAKVAVEVPAAPPPDGSAPNLAIAADALRTQAAAYRAKAERLEAMATELEG
jgi:hypothetical protein